MNPADLTPYERSVLLVASAAPTRASELADRVRRRKLGLLSNSNVQTAAQGLFEAGLLARDVDADRFLVYSLTFAGERVLDALHAAKESA